MASTTAAGAAPSPAFAYPSAHSSNPAYLGPRSSSPDASTPSSEVDPLALRRLVLPALYVAPSEEDEVMDDDDDEQHDLDDEDGLDGDEEEEDGDDGEGDVTIKKEVSEDFAFSDPEEPEPEPEPEPEEPTEDEMDYRPTWEREQLREEMNQLEDAVAGLEDNYRLVDQLGEGTFSSVYKAVDLKHASYDNSLWIASAGLPTEEDSRAAASSRGQRKAKVYVALKRIYVTSSPARIENEISILEDLRGCPNISQLITAFRYEDQIIAVMPFHCNDDFRNYYRQMSTENLKCYLRDMFRALRATHARGIIHRDVKPANFLYDCQKQFGILVDYGLAQRYTPPPSYQAPKCQHTGASFEHPHGKRERNASTKAVEQAIYTSRKRSKLAPEKIGFPAEDKRASVKANRAGTRGFRAPEVLFKCPDQNASIDIWSVGIILLSFLSRKFPIFNSNDDTEALMEISAIFGKARMDKCAAIHNRTFLSNLPSIDHEGRSLESIVLVSNPDLWNHKAFPPPKPLFLDDPFYEPPPSEAQHRHEIEQALDLLKRCLALDPCKRLTAADALKHPWLQRPGVDEDADGPRKPQEGVCKRMHRVEEPGLHEVWAGGDWHEVGHGDAVAMGDKPCPIHAVHR